jgi:hypothetical protein
MSKVYISSTCQDLDEHRRAAAEAIRRAEHEPIGMEDYSASEKRPLDKCLEDVRGSKAYVGLIAWRYGFLPPGQTKSITQLEYEEAGANKIPRFIFLSSDTVWPSSLRDPDPTRITEFRASLRLAHTTDVFESVHDLKFKVVAALKREIGDGVVIPPLLPYRCDRTEQYEELGDGLGAARPADSSSPLVCLVHGEEPQAVNKFLNCLREDAGSLMGLSPDDTMTWKEVPWPTEESRADIQTTFTRRAVRSIATGADTASPGQVAAVIDQHPGPLILHSRVFTDDWNPERALGLRAVLDYWRKLVLAPNRPPFLLLITVEYREIKTLFSRLAFGSRNTAVRTTISEFAALYRDAPNFLFIRELQDVRRYDAEQWAETEPVQNLLSGQDIREDLAGVYGSKGQMPMRPLAKELQNVLVQAIQRIRV